MKLRNIAIGVVVGGITIAGGVLAVAWQKGWSIRETVELGAGVIASKTSRHTIADRTAAILGENNEMKSRYLLIGLTDADKRKIRELSEGKRTEGCQKKVVRKRLSENSRVKTSDKLLALLKEQPHLTQEGMARAMGISRQAIQKHLTKLKASGRLRRIGPDKGGHWEVVG